MSDQDSHCWTCRACSRSGVILNVLISLLFHEVWRSWPWLFCHVCLASSNISVSVSVQTVHTKPAQFHSILGAHLKFNTCIFPWLYLWVLCKIVFPLQTSPHSQCVNNWMEEDGLIQLKCKAQRHQKTCLRVITLNEQLYQLSLGGKSHEVTGCGVGPRQTVSLVLISSRCLIPALNTWLCWPEVTIFMEIVLRSSLLLPVHYYSVNEGTFSCTWRAKPVVYTKKHRQPLCLPQWWCGQR